MKPLLHHTPLYTAHSNLRERIEARWGWKLKRPSVLRADVERQSRHALRLAGG